MMNKIFCKKNLIIIVIIALCAILACATFVTFASYSHEAKGSGTASPRGDYIGDGNSFNYIEKNIDGSFNYNFYLTNTSRDETSIYKGNVAIDFEMKFLPVLADRLLNISVEANIQGKWDTVHHVLKSGVATFKDNVGFDERERKINYYRIKLDIDGAYHLKEETVLFDITYRLIPKASGGGIVDTTDEDKQINAGDYKGNSNQIYLGGVKEILANPNDFSIVIADIPADMLIVNVYYWGELLDTLNVKSDIYKDKSTTYTVPYLIYAGAGYVPQPGYLGAGFKIVVYRPAVLPKGVTIHEEKYRP